MIATLIQISVMRSREWHVDVRLLSFAREGAQVRGLLVLKTGWTGFEMDRTPQRRLYCRLLWCLRFDMPLARRGEREIAYVSMREAYMGMTGETRQTDDSKHCEPSEDAVRLAVNERLSAALALMNRQSAEPQDDQAVNPMDGGL